MADNEVRLTVRMEKTPDIQRIIEEEVKKQLAQMNIQQGTQMKSGTVPGGMSGTAQTDLKSKPELAPDWVKNKQIYDMLESIGVGLPDYGGDESFPPVQAETGRWTRTPAPYFEEDVNVDRGTKRPKSNYDIRYGIMPSGNAPVISTKHSAMPFVDEERVTHPVPSQWDALRDKSPALYGYDRTGKMVSFKQAQNISGGVGLHVDVQQGGGAPFIPRNRRKSKGRAVPYKGPYEPPVTRRVEGGAIPGDTGIMEGEGPPTFDVDEWQGPGRYYKLPTPPPEEPDMRGGIYEMREPYLPDDKKFVDFERAKLLGGGVENPRDYTTRQPYGKTRHIFQMKDIRDRIEDNDLRLQWAARRAGRLAWGTAHATDNTGSFVVNPTRFIGNTILRVLHSSGGMGAAVAGAITAIILAPDTVAKLIQLISVKGLPLNRDWHRAVEEEVNGLFNTEEQKRRLLGLDAYIVTSISGFEPGSGSTVFNSLENRDEIIINKVGLAERAVGIEYGYKR